MKSACWVCWSVSVHSPYRVTTTNSSLWLWKGIQQMKKATTTATKETLQWNIEHLEPQTATVRKIPCPISWKPCFDWGDIYKQQINVGFQLSSYYYIPYCWAGYESLQLMSLVLMNKKQTRLSTRNNTTFWHKSNVNI